MTRWELIKCRATYFPVVASPPLRAHLSVPPFSMAVTNGVVKAVLPGFSPFTLPAHKPFSKSATATSHQSSGKPRISNHCTSKSPAITHGPPAPAPWLFTDRLPKYTASIVAFPSSWLSVSCRERASLICPGDTASSQTCLNVPHYLHVNNPTSNSI